MKAFDIISCAPSDAHKYLVEIKVKDENTRKGFLKVKETLKRIGIASKQEYNTLYQSCHILQRQGKHYIVHFKTLFLLDGRENNINYEDIARQNKIIELLVNWNLIEVINPDMIDQPRATMHNICVVPWSDRDNWNLLAKYKLGKS